MFCLRISRFRKFFSLIINKYLLLLSMSCHKESMTIKTQFFISVPDTAVNELTDALENLSFGLEPKEESPCK